MQADLGGDEIDAPDELAQQHQGKVLWFHAEISKKGFTKTGDIDLETKARAVGRLP